MNIKIWLLQNVLNLTLWQSIKAKEEVEAFLPAGQ